MPLGAADWESHFGKGESILVNAATWGLMLTGRMIRWEGADDDLAGTLRRAGWRVEPAGTGEEALDERWPNTPVIELETLTPLE